MTTKTGFVVDGDELRPDSAGARITVRDVLIARLGEQLSAPAPAAYPDRWTLHLDRLALGLSGLDAQRGASFDQVRDARTQARDQLVINAAGRIELGYDRAGLTWLTAVEGRYRQVEVADAIDNAQDRLRLSSQLLGWLWSPGTDQRDGLAVFVEPAFETEFTPRPGQPWQRVGLLGAGLASTWGGLFRQLRAGPPLEVELSRPEELNYAAGLDARYRFSRPLARTPLRLESELELRWLPWRALQRADALELTAEARQRLVIPLWAVASVAPEVELFVFRGVQPAAHGFNLSAGLVLSADRLWKIGTSGSLD